MAETWVSCGPCLVPDYSLTCARQQEPWLRNGSSAAMPRVVCMPECGAGDERGEEVAVAVSLGKGGNVSLSKEEPGLKRVVVGLGWDVRATGGAGYDLDASVFMLDPGGRVRGDEDFVFYNNPRSPDGSVEHTGGNLTGEGDDEQIRVDLTRVPSDVHRLAFSVTIHEADLRRQNFGMVEEAFIRVVNGETGREIVRYDLSEDASTETAMIFGEVYRRGTEWKFRAVGQGFAGGLGPLARSFGVDAQEQAAEVPGPPSSGPPAPGADPTSSPTRTAGKSVPVKGGRATMANGAWVNVHAYEAPVPPPAYARLEPGHELFAIEVEAYSGPNPNDYLNHFQMSDFNLQMPDNTRIRTASLVSAAKKPALYNNPLAPDDGIRGWVTFEKPKGEEPKFAVYQTFAGVFKWGL
jgi:tellurium resistance protein TerD